LDLAKTVDHSLYVSFHAGVAVYVSVWVYGFAYACSHVCTTVDDRRPAQGPDRMCAELSAAVLVAHTHTHTHTHLNELSVLALNVSFSLSYTLTHSHLATTNQTSRATDAHGGWGWQQESMLESPYQQCREQTVCFIF